MCRGRQVAAILSVALIGACLDTGDVEECREELEASEPCCDPQVYTAIPLTDLTTDPASAFGQRIEVVGEADWATDNDPCICAGQVCNCEQMLALRSSQCPAAIHLTGVYRGRSVGCANDGCWPLQLLSSYAVCGIWVTLDAGGAAGYGLEITDFCLSTP